MKYGRLQEERGPKCLYEPALERLWSEEEETEVLERRLRRVFFGGSEGV